MAEIPETSLCCTFICFLPSSDKYLLWLCRVELVFPGTVSVEPFFVTLSLNVWQRVSISRHLVLNSFIYFLVSLHWMRDRLCNCSTWCISFLLQPYKLPASNYQVIWGTGINSARVGYYRKQPIQVGTMPLIHGNGRKLNLFPTLRGKSSTSKTRYGYAGGRCR